jgi:hypothetical protein
MKEKLQIKVAMIIAGMLLITTISKGQDHQKIAQSGFQFLSIVSDARGAALGEAMTGLEAGSSSLFFNPAGLASMENFVDVSASHNQWIADIKHYTFSLAIKPFNGDYGVLGFTLQSVNYGDFYGTRLNANSPDGYDDTGIFTLNAMAVGVGYAKQLTDRFNVGAQIRFVHQDLGNSYIAINERPDPNDTTGVKKIADTSLVSNKLSPLVFDFGTQFKTGFKSLVFGMSVRNFSAEYKYAEESFQAPLVFTLGLSMDVMDLIGQMPFEQSLFVNIDACHHRDHAEQIKVGFDYRLMNLVSLRAGYASSSGESNGFSFGVGISQYGFSFDYAYTPYGIFDKVQRITARFSL